MPTRAQLIAEDLHRLLPEMGEEIAYTPQGGAESTINAIVDRNPLQPRGSSGNRNLQYTITITVSREDVANPVLGGDRVGLTTRPGQAAATYAVVSLVDQNDPTLWVLGLRA